MVFDRLAVSFITSLSRSPNSLSQRSPFECVAPDGIICGRPLGKHFYFGGERLAALGHMSGLLARTGSAGPDEVR